GIYLTGLDASVGKETRVFNNVIYNTVADGSGIGYNIYHAGSNSVKIQYNTVYTDFPAATGTGACYGIYHTTLATGIEYLNNNISINKGGTGVRGCIYFGVATSTVSSNYNNLYYGAAGTGTKYIGYWSSSANGSTIAAWQAVNAGVFDQNSVSTD